MSASFLLVIVVASWEIGDPSTPALARAAHDALGAEVAVVVRELPRVPADTDALALAQEMHANAVAEIAWTDAQHLHASVHLHVEGSPRWLDRELGFESADAPAERGRTIGFALASMMPERTDPKTPHTAPPPSASGSPPPAPPPLDRAEPAGAGTRNERADRGADAGRAAPLAPPRPPRGALDAAFIASAGVNGYAGGIGAALGGRWYLSPSFALRFGGGARAGDVGPAQASSQLAFGSIGLAWRAPLPSAEPFALGARTDLLVMWHQLSHLDSDDPTTDRQSR